MKRSCPKACTWVRWSLCIFQLKKKKKKTGHRGTSHRCNHQNLVHEKCYGTDDPVSANQFTRYLNTSWKPTASISPPWNLPVSYFTSTYIRAPGSHVVSCYQKSRMGYNKAAHSRLWLYEPELEPELQSTEPEPSVNSAVKQTITCCSKTC